MRSFRFLGVHIADNSLLVPEHLILSEEGTTAPLLPKETEEGWPENTHPQLLLQKHHREHPDLQHHCLVRKLLHLTHEGTAVGSEDCPAHHWVKLPCQ